MHKITVVLLVMVSSRLIGSNYDTREPHSYFLRDEQGRCTIEKFTHFENTLYDAAEHCNNQSKSEPNKDKFSCHQVSALLSAVKSITETPQYKAMYPQSTTEDKCILALTYSACTVATMFLGAMFYLMCRARG